MGSIFSGDHTAERQAQMDRDTEAQRQARVRAGTQNVDNIFNSQFNDDFYNKQQTGYLNYATPQLDDQLAKAKEALTFSLARGGVLNSSTRSQKEAQLQQEADLHRQAIGDQALSFSTQARNNVENARANLISTLNATGDAEGAANSAMARATTLSQPAAYSPVGQLFSDFLSGLGTQAAAEKATAMSGGMYKSPYNTGLFSGGASNAVKVTQ
jgi:hypothetical protein